jgi:hypothetical protein
MGTQKCVACVVDHRMELLAITGKDTLGMIGELDAALIVKIAETVSAALLHHNVGAMPTADACGFNLKIKSFVVDNDISAREKYGNAMLCPTLSPILNPLQQVLAKTASNSCAYAWQSLNPAVAFISICFCVGDTQRGAAGKGRI